MVQEHYTLLLGHTLEEENFKLWAISGGPALGAYNSGTLSGSGSSATNSINNAGNGYAFSTGPDGNTYNLYTKWYSQPTTTSYNAAGTTNSVEQYAGPVVGNGTLNYMVYSVTGSGPYETIGAIY